MPRGYLSNIYKCVLRGLYFLGTGICFRYVILIFVFCLLCVVSACSTAQKKKVCVCVEGRDCSPIFWEQRGHAVDPPAPFSLQLDLVGFRQLHPLTKLFFVISLRRTHTTVTRAAEGREIERNMAFYVFYMAYFFL